MGCDVLAWLPRLLGPLVVALVVAGCGGSSGGGAPMSHDPGGPGGAVSLPAVSEPGMPSPRLYVLTPEGVHLHYPVWLDAHPSRMADLLAYLRDVVPEADARIDPALRGVPAGTTVVVLDPGPYYAPYSPTGLASGEQRGSTLYVAWRSGQSGPVVPALPHELRHLLTGDPNAGH